MVILEFQINYFWYVSNIAYCNSCILCMDILCFLSSPGHSKVHSAEHQHTGWKSRNVGEKSRSTQEQTHESMVPFGALGKAGVSWGHRGCMKRQQSALQIPKRELRKGKAKAVPLQKDG